MTLDWSLLQAQLQAALAGYGPWGVMIAAAVVLFLRFRASKASPATPAPATPADPSGRPRLDAILKLLHGIVGEKFPDLHPDEALELHLLNHANNEHMRAKARRSM